MASLAEDLNVDELRRRARRRLVGAIVLALAAAVIVPMLLESEPRPLGEDVAVKIPPVDDGKFVNRLNDPSAKSSAGAPAAPKADTPAPRSEAPATAKAEAPKDSAAPTTAPITSPPAQDAAPKADASASPPPASASKPPTAPEKAPAPAPEKVATAPGDKAAAVTGAVKVDGAFAVQLAAFSDDKGANALAGKLKRAGYSAYTEPLKTSKGTLWRVRVGPYPSREAATAARDKLKAEGQNGIVAPAH